MPNFNNVNVNIKITGQQAMRLMSMLVMNELGFEDKRAKMSREAILEDDLKEINEAIDLCGFLIDRIDKEITNSCNEEYKSLKESMPEELLKKYEDWWEEQCKAKLKIMLDALKYKAKKSCD